MLVATTHWCASVRRFLRAATARGWRKLWPRYSRPPNKSRPAEERRMVAADQVPGRAICVRICGITSKVAVDDKISGSTGMRRVGTLTETAYSEGRQTDSNRSVECSSQQMLSLLARAFLMAGQRR